MIAISSTIWFGGSAFRSMVRAARLLQLPPVVSDDEAEERRSLARALALLRTEAGLTQEMAGEAFGGSGQNLAEV